MANLRIRIKQQQQFNRQQQAIYYNGTNPQSLAATPGTLPTTRQWRNYGSYIDVTQDVGDLQKLSLTWTQDRDANGAATPGATNMKRSASGTLVFEGEAYELLKRWLIDDVSAPLNAVEVEIHDTGCDVYFKDYVIRAKDLRYCEGSYCMFETNLQQKDEVLHCIKSTLITDNHQGWFPTDSGVPGNNKKHPRFAYCNEIRPNGQLVVIWKLGTWNFMLMNSILIPVLFAANGLIFVINLIIGIINAIASILGTDKMNKVKYIDLDGILETQEESFIESAGCGREHPAPLIRDYIQNVCSKCGVHVDAATAPIFFNPAQAVPFTSSEKMPQYNYHYRACYFNAPVKRGIRRSTQSSPFIAPDYNDTDYWIPDNAPIHTLDTFLDELKALYNADWRIVNNTLYFQRKDYFLQTNPVYNFNTDSSDRLKLLEGVCYEWNEVKYPAYTRGIYTDDPSDKCGNEAKASMNDMVPHGNTDDNPNFEGVQEKTSIYGATRFRLDGITPDYIADAGQANVNGGIFSSVFGIIRRVMDGLTDYELLLNEETASAPKILLWDGSKYEGAQCTRFYCAYAGRFPMPAPQPPINTKYNSGRRWNQKHILNTFTKGSNLNIWRAQPFNGFPDGYYTVRDHFGSIQYQKPALSVNYPMYMDAEYEGTMWDLFHFIDDPKRNPTMNQNWSLKMSLCCDDIEKLGVKNDAAGIVLGQKVQLPAQYYDTGKIKEITLSYDPTHELGAYIELKGNN
jgi:hypothetical protein